MEETKTKQIIPVGKRILVRQDEAEKKYGGGVIEKPEVAQDPPMRGEVIRASFDAKVSSPALLPYHTRGAVVIYGKYCGTDVSDEFDDGRVYKILDEEDVLAVVQ